MRQAGDENALFRDELERLAQGTFTRTDLERWMPRSYESLGVEEKQEWDRTAIMLASEKKDLLGSIDKGYWPSALQSSSCQP